MPRPRSTKPSPLSRPLSKPRPAAKSPTSQPSKVLSFDEFIEDISFSASTSPDSSALRTPPSPLPGGVTCSTSGFKDANPPVPIGSSPADSHSDASAGVAPTRPRSRAPRATREYNVDTSNGTQEQIDQAAQDARDFPGFEGYGHTTWEDATGEMTSDVTHYGGSKTTVAQIKELVALMNAPGMSRRKCMKLVEAWEELYLKHHKYIHLLAIPLDEHDTHDETLPGFTRAYFYPNEDWRNLTMPGVPTIDTIVAPERPKLLAEFGFDPDANQRVLVNVNYAFQHPCDACSSDDLACYTGVQDIRPEADGEWTWYRPKCEACVADGVECSAVGRWRMVDDEIEHYDPKAPAPRPLIVA